MSRSQLRVARLIAKYTAAVLLAIWVLLPIYLVTIAAFSTQKGVYDYPKDLLPIHASADTLTYFLGTPGVVDSLVRSIIVAALTLGIALSVGTPAGYALARFAFRAANAFRLGVVTTRAFPIVIVAIPLAVTFLTWGIDDTVFAVALVHAALAMPFVVLVTSSVFAGISPELEEAAMTLGTSRRGAFLRIALPLARPGLAAAAIFTFITSWNEVFAASVLTVQNRTLPALMLAELDQAPLPFQFAGGFFLMAPCFLVIFFSRKYLFSSFARATG